MRLKPGDLVWLRSPTRVWCYVTDPDNHHFVADAEELGMVLHAQERDTSRWAPHSTVRSGVIDVLLLVAGRVGWCMHSELEQVTW